MPALGNLATPGSLSSGFTVVTVGTGTCVPRLDRRGPCALVGGEGVRVAVDLGLGALHGMLQLGVRHSDLDAVAFTHLHPDHSAELVAFLFAANYDERPRTRPLQLLGGAGFARLVDSLEAAHGTWLAARGYRRQVRELAPGDVAELGGLRLRGGPACHVASSLAYRFEAAGRSAVITGDTGPCADLAEFARAADLLVAEASLPVGTCREGHLNAAQAGELASAAGVRRLVLTHLYPAAEAGDPAGAAALAFPGPVAVAADGACFRP